MDGSKDGNGVPRGGVESCNIGNIGKIRGIVFSNDSSILC